MHRSCHAERVNDGDVRAGREQRLAERRIRLPFRGVQQGRHCVGIARIDGSARSKLNEQEWRSDLQQLPALSPGRYEVQAFAVDRFGVESPSSPPVTLRVIGAELPDGARLTSDAILLGRCPKRITWCMKKSLSS